MPKYSKARAQELLWDRGDLRFKLRSAQMRIELAYRQSRGKLFVANCSRRLGKSFWGVCKAIECALLCKNPRPSIIIAAATKVDLKRFILPAFDQILADCPSHLMPEWRASDGKFTFPSGAEIHLIGLDKRPDAGRGNYCDLYIFEETRDIQRLDYLYSSVVSPMLIHRKGARVVMISTPPVTPAHPFLQFCERAQAQQSYIELDVYQNKEMSEADIEAARAECLTQSDWEREFLCKFVVDETRAIVPEWNTTYEIEVERPIYFSKLHRYVAMDLGTKHDFTAIVFAYYDKRTEKLIIEDEAEMIGPKMTTVELKKMIAAKEAELWPALDAPYRRVADNDNPLLLQDLGYLHGMHFVPTGKDELKAMVDQVRVMVKANRILVHPRCKKTLGCLRYGIWDERRKQFDRSRIYGHYDALAAVIYLVRNIDLHTNPLPLYDLEPSEKRMIRQQIREEERQLKALEELVEPNLDAIDD